MSSFLVEVVSSLWDATKSAGEFSVGAAPNGPQVGTTGLGSAGAGMGSPGGPGGDDPGDGGPDGGEPDGEPEGEFELGRGDEPYNHEEGLPTLDEPGLDTLDRTLWDAVKNLLDVGPGIGVLEAGPGIYRSIGETGRRERKINDLLSQDFTGDGHLTQGADE